jgi:hypothetical protein
MGLTLNYNEGQTPLDENEIGGLLIKTITTMGELNEFEQMNIEKAVEWTIHNKLTRERILSEEFVKLLDTRKKYISALKKADKGNIAPLIDFATN